MKELVRPLRPQCANRSGRGQRLAHARRTEQNQALPVRIVRAELAGRPEGGRVEQPWCAHSEVRHPQRARQVETEGAEVPRVTLSVERERRELGWAGAAEMFVSAIL